MCFYCKCFCEVKTGTLGEPSALTLLSQESLGDSLAAGWEGRGMTTVCRVANRCGAPLKGEEECNQSKGGGTGAHGELS